MSSASFPKGVLGNFHVSSVPGCVSRDRHVSHYVTTVLKRKQEQRSHVTWLKIKTITKSFITAKLCIVEEYCFLYFYSLLLAQMMIWLSQTQYTLFKDGVRMRSSSNIIKKKTFSNALLPWTKLLSVYILFVRFCQVCERKKL